MSFVSPISYTLLVSLAALVVLFLVLLRIVQRRPDFSNRCIESYPSICVFYQAIGKLLWPLLSNSHLAHQGNELHIGEREPLCAIDKYIILLQSKIGGKFNEKGEGYVSHLGCANSTGDWPLMARFAPVCLFNTLVTISHLPSRQTPDAQMPWGRQPRPPANFPSPAACLGERAFTLH